MMPEQVYIVDVFAEAPYAGNPLAVVLGADDLSPDIMQKLAAETNFSESTFVMSAPEEDGGYRVRVFTPSREIEFTGHPILGTAWVIRRAMDRGLDIVRLNLAVGQVPVTFETGPDGSEAAWFRAPPVSLGPVCSPEPMAAALGISPGDIDPRSPIRQCAAGTSAMIVPVRSLDVLRRCRLDLEAYAPLAKQGFPPLVYLFCHETHHAANDLCARFFFDAHGVREDPATGNGAAFLGAYLWAHRIFSEPDLSLRIEQGYEIRRPSLVRLRVRAGGDAPEVSVGGSVIPIFRGKLL
jgi:trans-2,3-dihydro-3-hydroxyanthranilate isomerase